MLFRCTERKYAEEMLNNGTIKFNTAKKWIEYEKQEGKGRGDLMEGAYAACNSLDFNQYSILKNLRKEVIIEQFANQKLFKDSDVLNLPAFCMFGVNDNNFNEKVVEEYSGEILDKSIVVQQYFKDFLNGKSKFENETDKYENQCVLVIIENPSEFFELIYKYFEKQGITRDEVIIQPVQYIEKTNPFLISNPKPLELFYKDNSFKYQSEIRIVLNSKNKNYIKKLMNNNGIIHIGNLSNIISIQDYYYNDMILAKNNNELFYTLSKPVDIPLEELPKERLEADLYQIVEQDIVLKSGGSREEEYEIIHEIERLLKEKYDVNNVFFPNNLQEKYKEKRLTPNN